jgi:hypothetical protein
MDASALPKSKVIGMKDKELLKWVTKVCPGVRFREEDADEVREMVKRKYTPAAEMSFNQPFPKNFGLDEMGKPDVKFEAFLEDGRKQQNIFSKLTLLFADPGLMGKVLEDLVGKQKVCSQTLLIGTHTPKEIAGMHIPYAKELLFRRDEDGTLKPHTRSFYFTAKFLDAKAYKGTSLGNRQTVNQFNSMDEKLPEYIKRCKSSYVNISVAYFVRPIAPLDKIFTDWKNGLVSHATRVLADLTTTPVSLTLLESTSRANLGWWEAILKKDLEVILSECIGREAVFKSRGDERCSSLQGRTGLCATWSIYLLLLNLLNPGVSVNKILGAYAQKDRNRLILRFGYFMIPYLKQIKGKFTRDDRVIPEWK